MVDLSRFELWCQLYKSQQLLQLGQIIAYIDRKKIYLVLKVIMRLFSFLQFNAAFVLAVSSSNSAKNHFSVSSTDELSVHLNHAVVHGKIDSKTPNVRQFLGIPYAQPPLNDLRFAPPAAAGHLGSIDATQLPLSCMQYLSAKPSVFTRILSEFNIQGLNTTGDVTEDCLSISIWAPTGNKTNLPVIIYTYGGSFVKGGVNIPYQIPAQWVQRTQDHIAVHYNYRSNIFGFPNAAGLHSKKQNVGLLDQRFAVEWVRDNIKHFGGDIHRIGLWGQSAGSNSVGFYGFAYQDDPIVSGLMMDSGTELVPSLVSTDQIHTNFSFVASQVGCGNLTTSKELSCMREIPAATIENFLHSYQDAGTIPEISFTPVLDNHTVFDDYYERVANGKAPKIVSWLLTTRHFPVQIS